MHDMVWLWCGPATAEGHAATVQFRRSYCTGYRYGYGVVQLRLVVWISVVQYGRAALQLWCSFGASTVQLHRNDAVFCTAAVQLRLSYYCTVKRILSALRNSS